MTLETVKYGICNVIVRFREIIQEWPKNSVNFHEVARYDGFGTIWNDTFIYLLMYLFMYLFTYLRIVFYCLVL